LAELFDSLFNDLLALDVPFLRQLDLLLVVVNQLLPIRMGLERPGGHPEKDGRANENQPN